MNGIKKKHLAFIWLIFLLIPIASAFEITQFGDGSSSKNLTWTGWNSQVEWVMLNRNYNVSNATIYLTWYYNFKQPTSSQLREYSFETVYYWDYTETNSTFTSQQLGYQPYHGVYSYALRMDIGSYGNGDYGQINQTEKDLSNVERMKFWIDTQDCGVTSWYYLEPNERKFSLFIDSDEVWSTGDCVNGWTPFEVDLSSYTGTHDVVFRTTYNGTDEYIDRGSYMRIDYVLVNDTSPTIITIDTTNEGNTDWSTSSIPLAQEVDLNTTAMYDYMRYTCDSDWVAGQCNITFNFTSDEGVLNILNLSIQGDEIDPYPQISTDHDYDRGFTLDLVDLNGTINITVTDEGDNVTCNVTIDSDNFINEIFNDETKEYDITFDSAGNSIFVNCTNDVGLSDSYTETLNFTVKKYILINEETGDEYSITDENITAYIINQGYNYQGYNFTFNSTQNYVYYISNTTDDIRFEVIYAGLSGIIFKDFNPALDTTNETRVCVAPEQTLYEQLLYSSSSRAIAVYNVYADCYLLMDYTKYAYGDALMLRAFTMPRAYGLYYWVSGSSTILANIDGGTASEISIDLIEFAKRQYTISILNEGASVSAYSNTTLKIYYKNPSETNDEIVINIKNGTTTLYTHTETTNPNDVTILWDHSALEINDTLLTLEVEKYAENEALGTLERLFYTNGAMGFLNPWVAILLSGVFIFFTLSFVAIRYTFGYFGIVTILIGLAILTQAPANQYIILMETIEVVMLLFVILMYKEEYARVV
jgi:hypothetical protein